MSADNTVHVYKDNETGLFRWDEYTVSSPEYKYSDGKVYESPIQARNAACKTLEIIEYGFTYSDECFAEC